MTHAHKIAFTAPHHQAAEIGMTVLEQGGCAVDAMIAAAAAMSVLYPHMNSLAGDGFWVIHKPGEAPRAIDACGNAAQLASVDWYTEQGFKHIPSRGALSALTLGGTLSGWQKAREIAAESQELLPLVTLLAPAIGLAETGITVTESLAAASRKVAPEFAGFAEYERVFMPNGRPLIVGENFTNPDLATFIKGLAQDGLQGAFRGRLAAQIALALADIGSPIQLTDLQSYAAQEVKPLSVSTRFGSFYNLPAPTQGIASLLILAIYDRIIQPEWDQAERIHALIEATKQAFIVRDLEVTDPHCLSASWPGLLGDSQIDKLAAQVRDEALPWPHLAEVGDTVWMGCVDKDGTMVSFIQSIYWEFGSGVVIPGLGLVWNNRGVSFSLDPAHRNALRPGCKPFHTLNPAFAWLNDGRRISYGTMGGEGQPQTQAALLTRYLYDGLPIDEAIRRGRWLLGRTWGDEDYDLKIERDLLEQTSTSGLTIGAELLTRGHSVKSVPACNELMGHAGAIVSFANGNAIAASDPRSDGAGLPGAEPSSTEPSGDEQVSECGRKDGNL